MKKKYTMDPSAQRTRVFPAKNGIQQKLSFVKSLLLAATVIVSSAPSELSAQCNSATYAVPSNNCGIDYISNVTFVTINNTTGCNTFALNSTNIPNVTQGQTYAISVTTGGDTEGIRAWIDYNGDGVFNNTAGTELILGPSYSGLNPATYNGMVTIPLSATPGLTRLRVRCNYASAPADPTSAQTWGETEDYCVNIISSTPCSGAPTANTTTPVFYNTCPNLTNPSIGLMSTYTVGGITYQWQSSTVSPVGPFTPINNATLSSVPVGTLGTTTWFQAVVTCTNGNNSLSLTPTQYSVAGTTTNSVPYNENFEGIVINNRLPNCSWLSTNLNTATQTYTSSNTNNRVPHTGNNFASFQNSPTGTNYFWTNGIQLEPGITYSAGLWFTTEYFGYTNWSSLSILYGSNQTNTGLTQIVSTSPAVSGPYKALGGLFTVPSSGLYYIAIRAVSASGSAVYLSWDDLSVTIPCTALSGNQPTVNITPSATTICSGDMVTINATGSAQSFSWSTGATGPVITDAPSTSTVYTVWGTNTLTGCVDVQNISINVNQSPNVWVVGNKASVCPGESAFLTAYGASSYGWSNGGNGSLLQVTPNSTTNYTVIGTALNGCVGTATYNLVVKPTPTITAISSNVNDICAGETVTLTATGGASYQWQSSSAPLVYLTNPLAVQLTTATNFTVTGTGVNGCSNKNTLSQGVQPCTSITENGNSIAGLNVYPNPTSGLFTVELKSGVISSVVITDIAGRVVMITDANNSTTQINMNELASGVYYARVSSANASTVVRVIKN